MMTRQQALEGSWPEDWREDWRARTFVFSFLLSASGEHSLPEELDIH
jgi:hypothetical protein